MVCGGATFKSVSDVLGHRTLVATRIYAKLDLASLAKVAIQRKSRNSRQAQSQNWIPVLELKA
jgi:site-specific recombinase XerC